MFKNLLIVWSKKENPVLIWWEKHCNKKLVITKEDDNNFEKSNKCWIYNNLYADDDVEVRDYYHVTWKYKGSAHRDCDIKTKLNHKIPIVFHNIKNYDSHLIMQELSKFDFNIKRHTKWIRKMYKV